MNPCADLDPFLQQLLQEQTCRWLKGERPALEEYETQIQQCPDRAKRLHYLTYLFHNECELRQERGESPSLAEYQERFPHLQNVLKDWFAARNFVQDLQAVNELSRPTQIGRYRLL